MPRLLAFAASLRRDSFNRRLLPVLVAGARDAGAEVTVVDLADYPLPIYDGDLESASGMPAPAQALLALLATHDGLLLATPEYNGFFPPLLKNTLDWMSRPEPDGSSGLRHFRNKPAAIATASPGGFGGLRSQQATRQLLANLGMFVLPEAVTVSQAGKAFAEDGSLTDGRLNDSARALGARLAAVATQLASR